MAQVTNQPGPGNGTQGDPPPGEGASEGEDRGLPAEFENIVNDRVNKAISTHMSRVRESIEKKIGTQLTDSLAPISEQLAALRQPPEGDDKGKGKTKEDEELKKALGRVADLERKNLDAEERFDQRLLGAHRVLRRDPDDADITGKIGSDDRLTHRLDRLRLVVLDPDEGLLDRQQLHEHVDSGRDAIRVLDHQAIVGRDVRLTLRTVDEECVYRTLRRPIQLHVRRKRSPA